MYRFSVKWMLSQFQSSNSNLDGPTRRFHGEISPIPETRPSYYISVDPRIRARLSQCEKPQETAETAHCRYTNPSNFLTI